MSGAPLGKRASERAIQGGKYRMGSVEHGRLSWEDHGVCPSNQDPQVMGGTPNWSIPQRQTPHPGPAQADLDLFLSHDEEIIAWVRE